MSATVHARVKCFNIEPFLRGLTDVTECLCTIWAHLETVSDHRKDGKWRWSGGMAESRYHHHTRSDNNQLLFTISPSEEVRHEGEAGGTHWGNHLIKGQPPAWLIIPRIPQFLLVWPSTKACEEVISPRNVSWMWKEIKHHLSTSYMNPNWTGRRRISARRSVIIHDTFRRAFLEAAVSWRVPGVKQWKDERFNQSESGHGRPARERPFALPQLQSFG